MSISRTCPRCSFEVSVPVSLIPLPAPYALRCPHCEEAIPTALAERAAWVRVQLWKLFFVLIAVSGFNHYGLKKLGSALLVMIVAGGLFGFLAAVLLGWLTQLGIDFLYFGVLGNEDLEKLVPGAGEPIVLARPTPSTPPKAGDNSPGGLHRQAVQADHQGDKALAWLFYRRFFEAPADDLTALRLPLAEVQQRFEVLSAELATWSADLWVNASSRLANDGRRDESTVCVERALQLDPEHPGAWNRKAAGAFRRGQAAIGMQSYGGGAVSDTDAHFEEAVRCFDRSLAGAPDKIGSWETKATALFFLRRPKEAAESFARARALKPGDERYLDVSEDESAIVSIDPTEKTSPAADGSDGSDGSDERDERVGEEATSIEEKATSIEERAAPEAPLLEALPASTSLELEALDLDEKGQSEEALRCFEQAVKADPRNARAWTNRAGTLSDLGRHEEALHSAETALKISARSPDAWGNKGRALAQLGRTTDALLCFEKALQYNPRHAMSWYNRGVSLLRDDQPAEAMECFEKALEIEPEHALARRAVARVTKALAEAKR